MHFGQKVYITWGDNDFGGMSADLVPRVCPVRPAARKAYKPVPREDTHGDAHMREGALGNRTSAQVTLTSVSLEHKTGDSGLRRA